MSDKARFKELKGRQNKYIMAKKFKPFKEGSRQEDFIYYLISKGIDGYVLREDLEKKFCKDLFSIENRYERSFKIASRINALISDVRGRFEIEIGKIWIPKESAFAIKVLNTPEEFDEIIKRIEFSIKSLQTKKKDLTEKKTSKEYRKNLNSFYTVNLEAV